MAMKRLLWLGDSHKQLQDFPEPAKRKLGYELQKVQEGLPPSDFKPMHSIGAGVEEIRVWVESGTYRVVYLSRFVEAVYVLHAFQKKTQQTSSRDLELARARFEYLLRERASSRKNHL